MNCWGGWDVNERAARSKSRDVPFRAGVILPSPYPPTHSNPNANLTPCLTLRVTSHAEMTFQICPFGNGTSLRGRHIAGKSQWSRDGHLGGQIHFTAELQRPKRHRSTACQVLGGRCSSPMSLSLLWSRRRCRRCVPAR